METPSKHHDFGPSTLRRRELCPGSWSMEKDLPEIPNDYADSGHSYHEAIAKEILRWQEQGADYRPAGDDLVIAMMDKFIEIQSGCELTAQIEVEKFFSYQYCGTEMYFGTADVVIVEDNWITIIDWKTGHVDVEDAVDNIQGAAYAAAAMKHYEIDKATVHFYNPRLNRHSQHDFLNRAQIVAHIVEIIVNCQSKTALCYPGAEQCRYCKAAAHGTCPAVMKTAETAVANAEKLLPLPSISALPAEELCKLYDMCKLVGKLGERVERRIKKVCEESGQCGKYKLQTTAGDREIKDINSAFTALSIYYLPEEFLKFCGVGITKLENDFAAMMIEHGKAKTKKEAKEILISLLGDLVTRKASSTRIVEA